MTAEAATATAAPAPSVDQLRATLPGRLALHARERPDAVALRDKHLGIWRERSWREYHAEVAAVAHALWELGVRSGGHVAILSDNCPEWLLADLGAQSIGARSVGIYQTNPPGDVAYILNDSGSTVLFCEDQEQVDKAVEVAEETPQVVRVVVFDPRGTRHIKDPRLERWEDFIARGQALAEKAPGWIEARLAELDPEEPAMVVYTSGTTGPPKGAMISSRNVLATSDDFVQLIGIGQKDSVLSYLPLAHVAEKIFSLFLPLTAGCTVCFGEAIETVQNDLREVSPTVFLGVPRIWEKMNAAVAVKMLDASFLKRLIYRIFTRTGEAAARRRLSGKATLLDRLLWGIGDLLLYRPLQERLGMRRVKLAVSGAAPISPDLLAWFHGIGVRVCEGFGMTESAGVSHLNRPWATRLGTVGQPLPGVEQRVGDDGELLLRGPNVFVGYLGKPEATRESIDEDGWLHTGDVAAIEEGGYLRITGRKKEILITAGGKNLSPEKIENALKTSPYVKEAVAIGDQRKFVSALVQIEQDSVADWAQRNRITYTSFEDLSSKPEVVKLIDGEIAQANELLARVEQVRAFRLLPKELHQDDGELTPTQKVRRREVQAKFSELIESMYGAKKRLSS